MSPGEKLPTTSLTGRNGILCRYFYFAMSLLLAAIVVVGFKRTVNENLFHPAVPRPFILWIHASAFTGWATSSFVSPRWSVYAKSVGIAPSDGLAPGSPR